MDLDFFQFIANFFRNTITSVIILCYSCLKTLMMILTDTYCREQRDCQYIDIKKNIQSINKVHSIIHNSVIPDPLHLQIDSELRRVQTGPAECGRCQNVSARWRPMCAECGRRIAVPEISSISGNGEVIWKTKK